MKTVKPQFEAFRKRASQRACWCWRRGRRRGAGRDLSRIRPAKPTSTQVEPICKTNTKANERILAGAEKKVKEGKLKVAAGQFTAGRGRLQARPMKQIKAVPQPVADQAKLAKWAG